MGESGCQPEILAAWAQAIGSVVLIIVTWWYSRLLVHVQHLSILGVRSVEIDDNVANGGWKWIITLRNEGQAAVLHVTVRAVVVTDIVPHPKDVRGWVVTRIYPAEGPYWLAPREEARYEFGELVQFKYPIIIEWSTATGYRQAKAWYINLAERHGQPDRIRPATRGEVWRFRLLWLWLNCFVTPFETVRKQYVLWRAKKDRSV